MSPCGIRTHDLSKRAVADLRLRLCGYWEWRNTDDDDDDNNNNNNNNLYYNIMCISKEQFCVFFRVLQ